MRKGRLGRGGAVLAAVFFLTVPGTRAQESALEETTLAVPTFSLSSSLGYIADDLGLWAKHGLRMKVVEIPGIGATNALIAGSVDFASPSASTLTRAAARGQRLLAIVEINDRPTPQLVLRRKLALAAGFDPGAPLAVRARVLRGRTIAVDAINSVIHGFVRILAKRAGFDPEAIRVAPMQPTSMMAAFDSGMIDGFAMSPPWPEKPLVDGTGTLIASGPDGDPADLMPFGSTLIATRPEVCRTHRSLCDKVGHTYAEAAAFVHDHPDRALALLRAKFPTLDDKLLAAGFAVERKFTPNPPVVTRDAIENGDRYNIEAGFMKPDEKLTSYDGLFTDEFVR